MVVFLSKAVPGDIIDIRITKKKKNYMEGIPENIVKESEYRDTPFCEHFGICGGFKWQNLKYEKQLEFKQQEVIDNFERIGKICNFKINPIIASHKTKYYRNKLEYTFSNNRWLYKEEIKKRSLLNASRDEG